MKGRNKNKSKMSILIGKTTLMLKLFPKPEKQTIKSIYNERLEKLFSRAPSNFGYKSDIEGIMDELAITKEQFKKNIRKPMHKASLYTVPRSNW